LSAGRRGEKGRGRERRESWTAPDFQMD